MVSPGRTAFGDANAVARFHGASIEPSPCGEPPGATWKSAANRGAAETSHPKAKHNCGLMLLAPVRSLRGVFGVETGAVELITASAAAILIPSVRDSTKRFATVERKHAVGKPSKALARTTVDSLPPVGRLRNVESPMTRMREWQQTLGDRAPLRVENPQPKDWVPPKG